MPVWARKPRTSRAKSRRRSVSQLTKLGKNFKRAKSSVLCYLFYWSSQKIVLCPTHTGNSNHWIDDSNTNLIQKHPRRCIEKYCLAWAPHGHSGQKIKLTVIETVLHGIPWWWIRHSYPSYPFLLRLIRMNALAEKLHAKKASLYPEGSPYSSKSKALPFHDVSVLMQSTWRHG